MENTSNFTIRLETLSNRSIAAYMASNLSVLLLFIGLSTRYGPHLETQELLVSKTTLENNSTLHIHTRIRGMTASHRGMDVQLQFKRARGASLVGIPIVLAQTSTYGLTAADIHIFGEDTERINISQVFSALSAADLSNSAHLVQFGDSNSSSSFHVGTQIGASRDKMRLEVHCSTSDDWCKPLRPLLSFPVIEYAGYNLNIRLTFPEHASISAAGGLRLSRSYGNVEATNYLVGAKLSFLCLSVACCALWFCRTCQVPFSRWSREQLWIGVLTCTINLFNDPFYLIEVALESWGLGPALYIAGVIGQACFWASLLLFWLVTFDHFRLETSRSRPSLREFYCPKLTFIGTFWLFAVIAWVYNLNLARQNPSFAASDIKIAPAVAKTSRLLGLVVVVAYFCWLGRLLLLLCRRRAFDSITRRFRMLGMLTGVTFLLAVIGMLLAFTNQANSGMGEWMGFYSTFNLYVFMLAFFFQPSKSALESLAQIEKIRSQEVVELSIEEPDRSHSRRAIDRQEQEQEDSDDEVEVVL